MMTIQKYCNPVYALLAGLIVFAFGCGVFFRGFDSILFVPALLPVLLFAGVLLLPGLWRGWAFPADKLAGFLFLFWLWMAVSLFWSEVPYISTLFCLTIGSLPLLFFSVVQHQNAGRIIDALWRGLAWAGAILALWAAVQFFFLADIAGTRIHHPMLNANNLAVILSLVLFLFLGLFCRAGKWGRGVYGVMIILSLIAVMATQSRGGCLGLVLGGVIFAIFCRVEIRQRWGGFLSLAIAVLLTVCALLFNAYVQEAGQVRLVGLGEGGGASINERFMLWGSALAMIRDHPFPGPGLGVFYLLYPRYRNVEESSDGYFLHVDPWQFGVEMSILAAFLFYGFAISILVRFIKAVKTMPPDHPQRMMLVVGFCGLSALGFNAHVNFDLYMLPALLLGAVFLMRFYHAGEAVINTPILRLSPGHMMQRMLIIFMLGLLLLAAPLWVIRAGIGVQAVNLAAQSVRMGDIPGVQKYSGIALRYGPENYSRAYYLDALWRERALQTYFIKLDAAKRAALYDGAMAALDRALAYNPYYVQALGHKAMLSYIAYPRLDPNGLDHAIAALERALVLDPVNIDVRVGLAELYEAQGKPQKALAVLEGGEDYLVIWRYAPASYLMVLERLKRESGDHEAAAVLRHRIHQRAVETESRRKQQSALDQYMAGRLKTLLQGKMIGQDKDF